MYTLINGSQKLGNSNSLHFLRYISEYLPESTIYSLKEDYDEILDSIKFSEAIVLAFPLYVDSPNSLTLKFLDYIYDNSINFEGKRIYAVINCGFREGKQNITALNIIKNWCEKVGLNLSGALLIGAGEMVGNKSLKFISKKAHKKLHEFSVNVSNNKECNTSITTIDILNNKSFILIANHSWTKQAKRNKLSKKDVIDT